VQPIGDLEHQHPRIEPGHVVDAVGVIGRRERDEQAGDLVAELAPDLVERVRGVFQHVVEERGSDHHRVTARFGHRGGHRDGLHSR
jgi:hypothetical protein